MDKSRQYTVSSDRDPQLAQRINWVFEKINERLNDLEHKSSKNAKKPEISRGEKMAVLYELGVLEQLSSLKISQSKLAALLGIVLNASSDNVEKDLSLRHAPKAPFKTKATYRSLTKWFKELGLEELERKAQTTLDKLED